MVSTNLKRAALALILSAAGGFSAHAQDEAGNNVTIQVDAQAGGAVAGAFSSVPGLSVMQWSSNFQSPAPFWIGVEGQPLDAAMRTALELPEKHGILVARVTEESPAAKAGLQAGDVLLEWCDAEKNCQPIKSVEHLVQLVQEAAAKQPDKAVKLEYRRRGKTETVELKPAKREGEITQQQNEANAAAKRQQKMMQDAVRSSLELKMAEAMAKRQEQLARLEALEGKYEAIKDRVASGQEQAHRLKELEAEVKIAKTQVDLANTYIRQAEQQLQQYREWSKAMSAHGFQLGQAGAANFDVLIPAPGIVTRAAPMNTQAFVQGHAQLKAPEWPENLSVTMKRTGNKPAEFTIERGEDKWQVTSETLKDLPPEVRVLVEPLAEQQRSRMMRLWSSSGDEAPGRVELRVPEGERVPMPGMPIAPPRVVIHANPQLQPIQTAPGTQKQIEDLQKALDQLRKQVEQMERK